MLSERHAQALAGIERRLAAEDPALARRFESGRTAIHRQWPTHLLIVVALTVMVGSAVLGLAAATLASALLAVGCLFVHARRGPHAP